MGETLEIASISACSGKDGDAQTADKKPGPDPDRLKLEGDWEESVKKALKRKRPPKERKEVIIMKVSPWHSIKATDPKVYHNNDKCTEGNNIESKNRREGTGGRPLCKHCDRIS